jgi:hypothetical protein
MHASGRATAPLLQENSYHQRMSERSRKNKTMINISQALFDQLLDSLCENIESEQLQNFPDNEKVMRLEHLYDKARSETNNIYVY